jgi:hypothetical protein
MPQKSQESSMNIARNPPPPPLPAPLKPKSSILRVNSLEDSLHQEGLTSATSVESFKRKVRFGNVGIRDYERIPCDNPSVSQGVPIG